MAVTHIGCSPRRIAIILFPSSPSHNPRYSLPSLPFYDPKKPRRMRHCFVTLSVMTRYRTAVFSLCRPHKESIGYPCSSIEILSAFIVSRSLPLRLALIICSMGSLTAHNFVNSTECQPHGFLDQAPQLDSRRSFDDCVTSWATLTCHFSPTSLLVTSYSKRNARASLWPATRYPP